ncbi:MAG: DEAD/DEAH box helicase [Anaerolineae bacterium]|nr:DEAD/DEAH box helicase [Anaerolineae bacterium]
MNYVDLGLHRRVLAGLEREGAGALTPCQAELLPPILAGSDALGVAPPGQECTRTFVLPILERLQHGPSGRIQALVLVPTREEGEAVQQAFETVGRHTRVHSTTLCGDEARSVQVERLDEGLEVVVACPGRLVAHLKRATIDLSRVELVVLDGVDTLAHMGFEPDIRRILKSLPLNFQMLMFCTSLSEDVRQLAQQFLFNPATFEAGPGEPLAAITHVIYRIEATQKTTALRALIDEFDNTTEGMVVFTSTKHRAKRLADKLKRDGLDVTLLQNGFSERRREAAVEGFRAGSYEILITTDAAARRLNVTRISHVVSFDMPDSVSEYEHRAGRAMTSTQGAVAINFVTDDDEMLVDAIAHQLNCTLETRTLSELEKTWEW